MLSDVCDVWPRDVFFGGTIAMQEEGEKKMELSRHPWHTFQAEKRIRKGRNQRTEIRFRVGCVRYFSN